VKFIIDMPLSPALVIWLREKGHDALHVSDLGLATAQDVEILEFAGREQRTILTADLDYPRLLALAQSEGPGLVLFRGGNYSEKEIQSRLERVLETISNQDLPKSIIVVEKSRIRQRRLPL
jgi:predicted nuclease of predicted toxin-antitoxin system